MIFSGLIRKSILLKKKHFWLKNNLVFAADPTTPRSRRADYSRAARSVAERREGEDEEVHRGTQRTVCFENRAKALRFFCTNWLYFHCYWKMQTIPFLLFKLKISRRGFFSKILKDRNAENGTTFIICHFFFFKFFLHLMIIFNF